MLVSMQRIVVQNRVTAQLDFCHSLVSAFWYREEERGGEGGLISQTAAGDPSQVAARGP